MDNLLGTSFSKIVFFLNFNTTLRIFISLLLQLCFNYKIMIIINVVYVYKSENKYPTLYIYICN